MSKEQPQPFRKFLVCYSDFRCISWLNTTEYKELLDQGLVNWASKGGLKIYDKERRSDKDIQEEESNR